MKRTWIPYFAGLLLLWAIGFGIGLQLDGSEPIREGGCLCTISCSVSDSGKAVSDSRQSVTDFSDKRHNIIGIVTGVYTESPVSRVSTTSKNNVSSNPQRLHDAQVRAVRSYEVPLRFRRSEYVGVLESLYTHGFYIYNFRKIII